MIDFEEKELKIECRVYFKFCRRNIHTCQSAYGNIGNSRYIYTFDFVCAIFTAMRFNNINVKRN